MVLGVAFHEKREGVPLTNTSLLGMRKEGVKNKNQGPEGQR